jgi:hypothetical protein
MCNVHSNIKELESWESKFGGSMTQVHNMIQISKPKIQIDLQIVWGSFS